MSTQELATAPNHTLAAFTRLEDFVGERLAAEIRERLRIGMADDVQTELSALLTLLPRATAVLGWSAVFRIATAIEAILAEKPQWATAEGLQQSLRQEMLERTSLLGRLDLQLRRGEWVALGIGAGLLTLLAIVFTLLVSRSGISNRTVPAEIASEQTNQPQVPPPTAHPVQVRLESLQPAPRAATVLPADRKVERPPEESRTERSSRRVSGKDPTEISEERPSETPDKPEAVAGLGHGDSDDFDREFLATSTKSSSVVQNEPLTTSRVVYIPPTPGSEIPESLDAREIMQAVFAHKPDIEQCAAEQKKKDTNLAGKIVMRWTILPSGATADVSCASEELASSHMAQCVAGLIRDWRFAGHKVQGEPIEFPFKF